MSTSIRRGLADFDLANELYAGATVTIYTVDPTTLLATTTLATLYTDLVTSGLLGNPQTLDGEGKWQQPVYVDGPVIMTVTNASVDDHTTGITAASGSFRGDWASDVLYFTGDQVRDGTAGLNTSNVYYCAAPNTSGVFATDLANGYWVLYISAQVVAGGVEAAAIAASLAAVTAAGYLTANQTITFSGDATGNGSTGVVLTLAASGVTAGSYTQVTVNAKGLVTGGTSLPTTSSSRDAILNGGFEIWQRGTSFSNPSSYAYTADKWQYAYNETGLTFTISQAAITDQAVLDEGWRHWYNFNQSVAGTGGTYAFILTRIEGANTFAGQTVTLELWIKDTSGNETLVVDFVQVFGTGGSPSANVVGGGQFPTVTSVPQKLSLQFQLPSIVGKTFGTNGDDFLQLQIAVPTDSVHDIFITGVKLRAASALSTPGPSRSKQEELADCQRFYETGSHFRAGYAAAAGSLDSTTCSFASEKRAVPTIAITPITSTNVTSQSAANEAANGFEHVNALTAIGSFVGHCSWTASADY